MAYFFLHFAITAWPFLNFYGSETNHKLVSLESFSVLFLIFWGGAILACELLKRILKTTSERLLVGYAFFILLFFSYTPYKSFSIAIHLPKPSYLFVFIVFLVIFVTYKLSKFTAFQKAVQLCIVVIFSFSFIENIFISLKKEKISSQVVKRDVPSYVFKERPNIYFLLLDTYPHSDVLKKNIQYENTEFVSFFKNKGFIVAENSYSNYPHTTASLSATLQMNFLVAGDEHDVFAPDKAVLNILKKNNYKFVSLPGYYDFLIPKNSADILISPSSNILFSLTNVNFLQTTILQVFSGLITHFLYFGNNEIKKIFQLSKKESKFVFIHFLHLHDFIYGKNCTTSFRLTASKRNNEEFQTNLSCINAFAEETINEIMTHDPESIIIVQGDHAPFWWRKEEEKVTSLENFDLMFSIFSAVYIPGLDKNSPIAQYLADSPSPVNNFRVIFSYLAKTPLELLPSRHFDDKLRELTHFRSHPENAVR